MDTLSFISENLKLELREKICLIALQLSMPGKGSIANDLGVM